MTPFRDYFLGSCIAVELSREVDWLVPEFHDASDTAAERDSPDISATRFPIRGDDRLHGDVPALFQVVVNEILQQHLIYISVRTCPNRPSA